MSISLTMQTKIGPKFAFLAVSIVGFGVAIFGYNFGYRELEVRRTPQQTTTAIRRLNDVQNSTKNLLQLPDDEFMKIQSTIQRERKRHLKDMCINYYNHTANSTHAALTSNEMLVIEEHKIVMCVTAKIGGKSWKRVLNVLAGHSNTTEDGKSWQAVNKARRIRRLSSYKPEELKQIFNDYTIIMFSRHPLTRTLSAFNNKLSPNATDYRNRKSFWRLGHNIMTQYRSWVPPFSFDTYNLTFPEFVRFLVDNNIPRSRSDNHWIENSRFCRPCDIPYTVIGRFETRLEDARYILKVTNVDNIASFPSSEGKGGNATQSSNFDRMLSYYKQVPMHDLQALIDRYKQDYLLFNYPIPSPDVRQWILNTKMMTM